MPPRHLPFVAGEHRHRVGTRRLDPAAWIEDGPDAAGQRAEKRRLLERLADEIVVVPDDPAIRSASEELLAELHEHLARHLPDTYSSVDGTGHKAAAPGLLHDPATGAFHVEPAIAATLHPLDLAARLVAEDLCLHLPDSAGVLRLVAGSVAFPSRWRLRDKVGRPVAEIHSPVPGYDPAVAGPVDRLLAGLPADRGMWRLNASLLDDATLHQLTATPRATPARVPEDIVIRVERQTVRRLARSGAVVFTIRTHVDPLDSIADDAEARAAVAGWVRGLPPRLLAYKALGTLAPDLLAWLEPGGAPERRNLMHPEVPMSTP